MRKRILASAFAVALAVGLTPLLAFADEAELSAGTADAASIQMQADENTTVYVLTKISSEKTGSYSSKGETKYLYNEGGLLAKTKGSSESSSHSSTTDQTFFYDGNKLIKQVRGDSDNFGFTETFKLSKKGVRKSALSTYVGISSDKSTEKFTYKSGRLVSNVRTLYWHSPVEEYGSCAQDLLTMKYNKKGQLVELATTPQKRIANGVEKEPPSTGSVRTFAYDKKGNLIKDNTKSTYKKGRLVKQVSTSDSGLVTTRKYAYKAVQVPAANVKTVQAQQWALLNDNLNYSFGDYGM